MRRVGVSVLLLLLWLSGCGKKEQNASQSTPPVAQSTQSPSPAQSAKTLPPKPHRFVIEDLERRKTWIEFGKEEATFHRIRQPLVAIVLFADWCPPCRGMLPYLSRLQAKNRQDLFLIGIPVRSDLNATNLRKLTQRYEINFFVSKSPDNDALGDYLAARHDLGADYPLPLTLLYKNGKYLMHIQGAAPYEMLQSLIDQLKTKPKKDG